MCTLLIGRDVLGPGTLILAANRDENPGRASDPPRVLTDTPRLAGGRDRVAGGTWLAIRECRAAVAMLNRRPARAGAAPPRASLRSRGLLTLDVAAASEEGADSLAAAARARLHRALSDDRYAPFSLAYLSPENSWLVCHDPERPLREIEIENGWHVLTHTDLDDRDEPRTRRLLATLAPWTPATPAEAEAGLLERLRLHDDDGAPPVCIHDGPMVTVSSAIVTFDRDGARYLHVEGRPCRGRPEDHSGLLAGPVRGRPHA